jgi:ribonuclease T
MKVQDTKTAYVCVDIEASGPVPGFYNMVSIGGVVVRLVDGVHVRGEEFYYELKPVSEGFDAHAMSIHGISRAHLEAHGTDARVALNEIVEWVSTIKGDGERVLFVGHNAPFDWMYVAWYFAWAGLDNPFGYNALDTKAMMMGRLGLPWRECNKERLLEEFEQLTAPNEADVHNALHDAQFQADILIALLDHAV